MEEPYYKKMETVWRHYPSVTSQEAYDAFYVDIGLSKTLTAVIADLMAHVSLKQGRMLEFGCDNGIVLTYFRPYSLALYGVDINEQAIANGRQQFPDLHLSKNEGIQVAFPDNHFDMVLVSGLLKHIRHEDRPALYDEFARVARYIMAFDEITSETGLEKMGQFTFYRADYSQELNTRFSCLHQIWEDQQFFGLYDMSQ